MTHRKFDTFIFDLDGTLLNTLTDLANAVRHTLSSHGLPTRNDDEIKSFLGNGYQMLLTSSAPKDTPKDKIKDLLNDFKKYYELHCKDTTQPYQEIIPVLEKLREKGIKTAIVSNKGQDAVTQLAQHFFHNLVSTAIGETAKIKRKPAPDTILEAIKQLKSSTENTCYIGDSEVDIIAAQNAGIPCLSCTWGFRTKDFLINFGAKELLTKPTDLLTYL